MITVILGNYTALKTEEIKKTYHPSLIFKSSDESDKTPVYFADELSMTREDIEYMRKRSNKNIKIVTQNKSLVARMKTSAEFKIIKNDFNEEDNPFDITKIILNETNRVKLRDYLVENKISLFMPVKILANQYEKLSEKNRKCVAFLDAHLFKVQNDILYHLIAFQMHNQSIAFLQWLHPKKKKGEGE